MKLKNLNLLLLCVLLLSHCVYAQPNIVEQLRELHKRKSQGLITKEEFEQQKSKITESRRPEAKNTAKNTRAVTEKKKQEQIAVEKLKLEADKKRVEDAVIEAKELALKFPLHAAVRNRDKVLLQNLLKSSDLQINVFDSQGATAWDLAYKIEDPTVSFDFCKMIKDAGGVSSKAIKDFELEKLRENLVTLKVCAGVSYKIGGYQPFVGARVALCKLTEKPFILGEVQGCLNIFKRPGLYQTNVSVWGRARENLMDPLNNFIDSKAIVKMVTTDQSGSAIFEDIEPDNYLILFGGPTRSNFGIWLEEISCKEKVNSLVLTESNAYFID